MHAAEQACNLVFGHLQGKQTEELIQRMLQQQEARLMEHMTAKIDALSLQISSMLQQRPSSQVC